MTCKPISVKNNNNIDNLGRAFFSIKHENEIVDLFCKNIYELYENSKTPESVKSIIDSIWDVLEIPGCYVTAEILKKVFDFQSNEENFSNIFCNKDLSLGKTANQAHILVKEKLFNSGNANDKAELLLQNFIHSKLGILLLRHMIDLPAVTMKELDDNLLSVKSLDSIDKLFLKSPYCNFYVNNIEVDLLQVKDKKNKYFRTRPIYSFAKKRILNEEVESDQYDKKFLPSICYVYGNVLASYMGHTGNFYIDEEEFESRKHSICSAWNNRENYMKRKGNLYSTPKWYDSYAGANNLKDAKYQLILSDAPPNSIYSTLSAMKRNLIMFLYICRLHISYIGNLNGKFEDLLENMAESIIQYFIPTTFSKCPMKMSNTSKSQYIKFEESVLRAGIDINIDCWLEHLERKGLDDRKFHELQKISKSGDSCYQNIKMINCLSGRELPENDRLSLSKQNMSKSGHDESDSLAIVPMMLYSYLNTMDASDRRSKIVAGIATQISPFQNSMTPVFICKSSLLYGKKVLLEESNTKSADEDLQKIIDQVELLCKKGYTTDESFQLLSLTDYECELVKAMLENDDEEPNRKKSKMY